MSEFLRDATLSGRGRTHQHSGHGEQPSLGDHATADRQPQGQDAAQGRGARPLEAREQPEPAVDPVPPLLQFCRGGCVYPTTIILPPRIQLATMKKQCV